MRLNSVCGKHCLHISCECSTRVVQIKCTSLIDGADYSIRNLFPEQPCLPWTRFQLVAAFGDKICCFDSNVSEMKQLAGHDFEDLLQVRDSDSIKNGALIPVPQCIIPCIEGLFPEPHNTSVIELLFIFATWHALTKLHVHTDTSLRLLNTATTALRSRLRFPREPT